jgi:hypothetical protein
MRSECGARGRGHTLRSRAAWASACRHYDRCVRCFTGLGQAGTGNARGAAQGLRPPVGAGLPDRALLPGPRKHGLRLSQRRRKSLGREPWWNADRRARFARRAPRASADNGWLRLPAFRFLFRHCERSKAICLGGLVSSARMYRTPALDCFVAELVIGPATSARTRWLLAMTCKTRARARRENDLLCPSPRERGGNNVARETPR